MKTKAILNRLRVLAFFLVGTTLLLTASIAFANTKTLGGGDLPLYARLERGFILNDGEWAVIIFYRPTECIPPNGPEPLDEDFNLLDTVDFNAFFCGPPTTDGIAIWQGEPGISPPIQLHLQEVDLVPVWFVKWDEMESAIADDWLNMPELEALPSLLIGSADFYSETLHPTDAHNVPMINLVAQGSLEDGRAFAVHALGVWDLLNVKISFR